MRNNISSFSLKKIIHYLKTNKNPILTHSKNVNFFEKIWSNWLGVKYSVMVNSGASANLITMSILKELYGNCEVIVPTLTWVSDISSILFTGLNPVFIDISLKNLAFNESKLIEQISLNTKAIFLTHILGFNGFSDNFFKIISKKNVLLIEDVCESHGTTHYNQKLGSFGWISNFSFYYAHHLSTIEGGMICSNDRNVYELARLFRSHGMVREISSEYLKRLYVDKYNDLNKDFIFAVKGFNNRPVEFNGILGSNQITTLDCLNIQRSKNLIYFLSHLNSSKFFTEFKTIGNSNYALPLILKSSSITFRNKIEDIMKKLGIEFRRGLSGGGNQARQVYLKRSLSTADFKITDHIHFFSYYIGNYPNLSIAKIKNFCKKINSIKLN